MEIQELIPNFFRARTIIFIIFKVQQHVNLREYKEKTNYTDLQKEKLSNQTELCNIKSKWSATRKKLSIVNSTCSWGGDRNSFVFLAVRAADMFKACITSLYRKRWFSWSLATKSSENATMASIRCRTWQSHRYWSRWHIWIQQYCKSHELAS